MKKLLPIPLMLASACLGYYADNIFREGRCMDAGGLWSDQRKLCLGLEWHPPAQ